MLLQNFKTSYYEQKEITYINVKCSSIIVVDKVNISLSSHFINATTFSHQYNYWLSFHTITYKAVLLHKYNMEHLYPLLSISYTNVTMWSNETFHTNDNCVYANHNVSTHLGVIVEKWRTKSIFRPFIYARKGNA